MQGVIEKAVDLCDLEETVRLKVKAERLRERGGGEQRQLTGHWMQLVCDFMVDAMWYFGNIIINM